SFGCGGGGAGACALETAESTNTRLFCARCPTYHDSRRPRVKIQAEPAHARVECGLYSLFLHRLLHRPDQLLEGEGLGQERELLSIIVRRQAFGESILGVARDEDDIKRRSELVHLINNGRVV